MEPWGSHGIGTPQAREVATGQDSREGRIANLRTDACSRCARNQLDCPTLGDECPIGAGGVVVIARWHSSRAKRHKQSGVEALHCGVAALQRGGVERDDSLAIGNVEVVAARALEYRRVGEAALRNCVADPSSRVYDE